ncbi:high-affinity branched-chain amino acid ABC transporter permease LivM [Diaphorobacter caeni]|uniref:high-affinity branched-chain amino acid ABC transporter permease LivM n=1 Tax=Diaphorobacter caeni TaxID=2784387 RepID=UPI00188E09BF|nr:high-affinity branched-chain amino acid ABC transporter permease LivM [Diaphorobacter caeni]
MTTPNKEGWQRWLADAGLAALAALVLGIPFIGLTTVDVGGKLEVHTRWSWLLVAAVAVFAGRMVVRWLFERQRASRGKAAPSPVVAMQANRVTTTVGAFALGMALVLPIFFYDNRYVVDTATTVLIYVMLGWGLNVVVGLAGLLDLGYVAFYAVGAYTYALLATQFGFSFWWCLPIAGAFAAAAGVLLGYPMLRLRGDYLAIVTLGFGEIIRLVLLNWTELTHGPDGVSSIPRPSLFGLPFAPPGDTPTFAGMLGIEYAAWHRTVFLYLVILVLALLTNILVLRLRRLPIGRAWEAMREDEIACKALGINVTNVKLSAFALGATLGGFAGVFFAAKQGFISPESFTFAESAMVLAIVVLGGSGSQLGVVLAACVLVLLPELGRNFSEYRMMLFGAAMVTIMVWRPGGLLSERRATLSSARKGGSAALQQREATA